MIDLGHRASVITYLIRKYRYKSVLEIGVRAGVIPVTIFEYEGWKHIRYNGVDPASDSKYCTYHETSDSFFNKIFEDKTWELIFIDGLHTMEQCDKDLKNSLKHLAKGGTIVMHDCVPSTKRMQRSYEEYKIDGGRWNGTVWKSYVKLRMTRPDLFMCVIGTDSGVGIIQEGKQKIYDSVDQETALEFDYYIEHRTKLLNLITIDEFLERFKL